MVKKKFSILFIPVNVKNVLTGKYFKDKLILQLLTIIYIYIVIKWEYPTE